jgi:hypothetical membrane protein
VVVGVAVYVGLEAVAQSLPPHYSPIRDAESNLAVGPYGYIMTANFVLRGALSLLFLHALAKTFRASSGLGEGDSARKYPKGTCLFGIWSVGAIVLAAFPTDGPAAPVSWHGAIHVLVAALAFIGGALGALMLSMQFGENRELSAVRTAAVSIAVIAVSLMMVVFGLPFVAPHLASRIGGMTERLFLGSVLLWMAVVSGHLATRRPAAP